MAGRATAGTIVAASCGAAAGALLLGIAAFGPWQGGSGPRLLPLCAALWFCAALLPRSAAGADPAAAAAALPLFAAAALHDDPQGAQEWTSALIAGLYAALAWFAAAAGRGDAARLRLALYGGACLGLPALEASIALGGAPATGGAPQWLSTLAGLSPLRVLLVQAGGGQPSPWAALLVLAALAAIASRASRAQEAP